MATEYPSSAQRELSDRLNAITRRLEALERRVSGAILQGVGPPPESEGYNGDWWLDEYNGKLYGPKGRVAPDQWPAAGYQFSAWPGS